MKSLNKKLLFRKPKEHIRDVAPNKPVGFQVIGMPLKKGLIMIVNVT